MNKVLKNVAIVALTLFVTAATLGQAAKSDISSVVAAGNVNGDVYKNAYFGISLTAPSAKCTNGNFCELPVFEVVGTSSSFRLRSLRAGSKTKVVPSRLLLQRANWE